MNVVYVFDKNYLDLYELSSKSLLKHNPDAKITVVSPEPLPLKNNVVIKAPKLKHNENDRITPATYLKLLLPQLPFDKIIEERGKKYKICPRCGWKHTFEETECRFCGSQL